MFRVEEIKVVKNRVDVVGVVEVRVEKIRVHEV